ncbi:GNAT family N-acetyltransferase [soil metagenome]
MLQIRPATENDIPAITDIYNEAIEFGTATFDTDKKTIAERLVWFKNHDSSHPIIVAVIENNVIGWASLSRWSERAAYDSTAEVSVYVHKDFRDKGTGKRLMEIITIEGEKAGLHSLISRITEGNEKSIYLHDRLGFENVGILKEVGKKFGRYLSVHIMQKVF